jgi:uroporphyrin-III C-methyltransferase/precorrin-2 dehydrogenase/sirohydrochlorin ferrochelatase
VVVSRAAQTGEQVVRTTLAALGDADPVPAPSVLIAGWAVRDAAKDELQQQAIAVAALI